MLVSGGLTTDFCLYPLKNSIFPERNLLSKHNDNIKQKKLKHITSLPQFNTFYLSTDKNEYNLILNVKNYGIELWKFDNFSNFEFLVNIEVK